MRKMQCGRKQGRALFIRMRIRFNAYIGEKTMYVGSGGGMPPCSSAVTGIISKNLYGGRHKNIMLWQLRIGGMIRDNIHTYTIGKKRAPLKQSGKSVLTVFIPVAGSCSSAVNVL